MINISKEEYERLVKSISDVRSLSSSGIVNGDKKELFQSVSRIEESLKGVHKIIDLLPFHTKQINNIEIKLAETETKIEKAKWVVIIAILSIVSSVSSLGSVVLLYLKHLVN